jgi:hypothetical protein
MRHDMASIHRMTTNKNAMVILVVMVPVVRSLSGNQRTNNKQRSDKDTHLLTSKLFAGVCFMVF